MRYPRLLWFPIAWSRANGRKPVPFDIWMRWHYATLIPTETA